MRADKRNVVETARVYRCFRPRNQDEAVPDYEFARMNWAIEAYEQSKVAKQASQ